MKEQIYTIPVTEAFETESECPFCNMYKRLDDEAVEYMLGSAYMDDEIRIQTDQKGFCKEHYKLMFEKNNRLGLALMLHTHIKEINKKLEQIVIQPKIKKKGLFYKKNESQNEYTAHLNNITNSCFICNRIDDFFTRYVDTFFYMWTEKPEIKNLVQKSRGFCIPHFSMLIEKGAQKLKDEYYQNFLEIVLPIQKEYMKILENDVEWFTDKFDYRFKDEPWKNSKYAVERAINKVCGANLKGEESINDR